MISAPGIYDMPAAEYHADCCIEPSLSSSVAKVLIGESPRHARFIHPRLNAGFEREEREIFDLGSAAHGYLLQGETAFVVIDAADWRTNVAKAARATARLAGKIPLLAHQWDTVQAMGAAVRYQLEEHHRAPTPFTGGRAEQTLVWTEGGIFCRARLDWLHDGGEYVDDLKTTGATANPDDWTRRPLFDMGYDLQAAWYLRGLKVLFDVDATFRFVVAENYPPYALSVISLGPDALVLAEKKRRFAVELWRTCLTSGRFPGYPTDICWADLPPWEEARWLARELRDEYAQPRPTQTDVVDDGRPIGQQLAGMGDIR